MQQMDYLSRELFFLYSIIALAMACASSFLPVCEWRYAPSSLLEINPNSIKMLGITALCKTQNGPCFTPRLFLPASLSKRLCIFEARSRSEERRVGKECRCRL